MPRKQTTRSTTTSDDENVNVATPANDIREKIDSIEREVNRRFEEIERELNTLKTNSEQTRAHECKDDERFLKLCHGLDYVLERLDHEYDTLACREMVLSLLGQRSARPFSGRTIRNRLLCRRMKRWCLCVALILFIVACMSIYGLHRNWSYLLVIICVSGTLLSWIGLRRVYKIIEAVW